MHKKIFLTGIAAAFVVASVGIFVLGGATSAAADGHGDGEGSTFADISTAVAITDSSEFEKIRFHVGAAVPTDGSYDAFGYGVLSSAGLDAIIVTTTHAGVYDSIAQEDADDASFHNHYVKLAEIADDAKCPGLEVVDISFQEPGDVSVYGSEVVIEDAPYYFGATHSLTQANISFNADAAAGNAVYFTIDPVDGDGNTSVDDIEAVCINNVETFDVSVVPASYWEGN